MASEVIEIVDNVTAPARKAASALRALDKAWTNLAKTAVSSKGPLEALGRVMDTMGGSALRNKGSLAELDAQIKKLRADTVKPIAINIKQSTGGVGSGGSSGGGDGGGLLGAAGGGIPIVAGMAIALKIATEIKEVIKEVVHVAIELGSAAVKAAVEMTNFKSATLASFQHITGSRVESEKLFENAKAISRLTGEGPEHVVEQIQKLISDGFSPKAANKILLAVANTSAVRGKEAGDKLANIFDTLKNKGSLDKGTVRQLAKVGIDTGTVYQILAEKTHKSLDQVKADLKAGRIDADLATAAITQAANKKFGGAAKNKADTDIFILLARAQHAVRALFEDVDIGPIRGALKNAVSLLEGPGGKALKGAIGGTVGQLIHTIFDPFSGPGGAQRFQLFAHAVMEALAAVTAALKAAAPYVTKFVDIMASLGKVDAKGSSGLDKVVGSIKLLYYITKSFLQLGVGKVGGFGDIAKAFGQMMGGDKSKGANPVADKGILGGVLGALGGPSIGADVAADQPSAFEPVGDQMDAGVIAGIEGGKSGVVNAARNMATAARDAANSALEIHSPSKVFARIGGFVAQGMAQGMNSDTSPAVASASMAQSAANAAVSAPSGSAGGGAFGGASHTFNITMPSTVHAKDAEGGQEAADAMAQPMTDNARDAFVRVMREIRENG